MNICTTRGYSTNRSSAQPDEARFREHWSQVWTPNIGVSPLRACLYSPKKAAAPRHTQTHMANASWSITAQLSHNAVEMGSRHHGALRQDQVRARSAASPAGLTGGRRLDSAARSCLGDGDTQSKRGCVFHCFHLTWVHPPGQVLFRA